MSGLKTMEGPLCPHPEKWEWTVMVEGRSMAAHLVPGSRACRECAVEWLRWLDQPDPWGMKGHEVTVIDREIYPKLAKSLGW